MTQAEFGVAVALDLALGDPHWLPHPVRAIGWLVARGERTLRNSGLPLRFAGIVLCLGVTSLCAGAVWATLPWGNVYWVYSFLAFRSLDVESSRVIRLLEAGDHDRARTQLAMIVGRDTDRLDAPEIVRASLETLSENFGDGVIAPLFYLACLGPAGMAVYKAVNTLDSMVGYKDERYRDFGWASARLDDALNYVPARLSALLVWIASALLGKKAFHAVRVTLRDASSQPSPNSGWPEAAFAGALGVRLGGLNHYRRRESRKAYLGDGGRALSAEVFREARVLYFVSGVIAIAGVWACL